MGQYRLWVGWGLQLGFLVSWEPGYGLDVVLPFLSIKVGLTDGARGAYILGWEPGR